VSLAATARAVRRGLDCGVEEGGRRRLRRAGGDRSHRDVRAQLRRTGLSRLCCLLEPRPALAWRDPRGVEEHDGVSDLEFGEREVDGIVERATAQQEPSDTSPTGHSRALAGVVGHDPDALRVGEGALALSVGLAVEAARGEATSGLTAPARAVREGPNERVGPHRSRETAARFAADVAQRPPRQQPDAA
jgi:hypothetical protein